LCSRIAARQLENDRVLNNWVMQMCRHYPGGSFLQAIMPGHLRECDKPEFRIPRGDELKSLIDIGGFDETRSYAIQLVERL
jgi:hypothetical protein